MISAFVPTLNNENTIRRVLRAIKAQTVSPSKFIVIDSGSTDGTERICREEGFEFYPPSHFGVDGILGLGRARNRILELIDTPYLLSVDSDIVLRPDHIESLLPILEANPELAGVAGKQIELNRTEMGDRCRALVDMRDLYKPLGSETDDFRDFLLGSNSIYRTDALHNAGIAENGNKFRPFDDNLMSNYEDVDIGIKLRKLGYKLLWHPAQHTYHLQKDDVASYLNRAYRYRVFKWSMQGAFQDETLYRKKAEHNINYTRMGFDIITEKSRTYLVYPYILAGFKFFLEDVLRFPENSPTAQRIYNSFIKSLEHFTSEKIRQGVLDFNKDILDRIKLIPSDETDGEIFNWFCSLATLGVLDKKFPAMHDTKLTETDTELKTKAVEASLLRMGYEKTLNAYGDFRVLTVNLPWRQNGRYGINAGSRWPHTYDMSRYKANIPPYVPYPFFLGHLASLLKQNGISAWINDCPAEGYSLEEFLYETFGYAPALLVAETSAPSFENDMALLKQVKEFLPETKICVTGSHTGFLKEKILEHNQIDFAVQGEYELSVLELALCLKDGKDFSHIDGLICKDAVNPPRKNTDFAALPRPERLITPFYNYNDRPVNDLSYPSFQTQLSRGCPYRCCFCQWVHTLYAGGYRKADTETVVSEIKYAAETFGIRSFYLDDETFNIEKKHLHNFCDSLERMNVNLPWMAMARADGGLDEEILIRMKKNGLIGLKFGIESVDENVLKEINKKLDIKKCEETLALCRKHGIETHLTFSIGYMADTEETIRKTFDWMIAQNPDSQQVSIVTPFPGTPMYDELIKSGVLDDDNYTDFDGHNALAFKNGLGKEKTLELKNSWIEGFRAAGKKR
jgi:radical SAM superfamily enzyme YgiQ (UPF0313 family)/glycosyltransferase involved in cell wall biosynthesis